MAVVKRAPGHCLVLCCVLLLLTRGGHTTRDTMNSGKGSSGGRKTPPHAQPPPAPDQGAHPDMPAQIQPQQIAANVGIRTGYLAEADMSERRLGGSSFKDQQRVSSAAGRAAQQEAEQQPQQQQRLLGAEILASGTVGTSEQQPEEQPGSAHDHTAQSTGSKAAAREGLQQPKALHDEQFPGNGAQGDHEKPDKQLQAANVQAQQPKGLRDAAQQPEKQRQASSFEVIGGQSAQEADQLSATLKRLEGLRGVEEAPGQTKQAGKLPEEVVQKNQEAPSIETANTKPKPLRGFQELIKAVKDRWSRHKAQLQRAREREARRTERQYLLALRARAKGEQAARRAARAQLMAAAAEAEKKDKEAAEEVQKKAEASKTELKTAKEDKEQYQRGVEMLDAAIAMDEHVQSPEMTERFRALRTEGRARNGRFRRGILIPTGGTTLINHAYASISVLRNTLNCTLPIELVYNGEFEMNNLTCHTFETDFRDVKCIDAAKLDYYPAHHRPVSLKKEEANAKGAKADTEGSNKDTSGFQFKIFALCYITTFDEVLMLDADNLPLRNPKVLFDTREYRRSGTLFFSDWWDMTEWVKPQAYNAFGLPYPGDEAALLAQESGQLLFNRNLHADALEWLWFINSHSEVIYKLMYGDKDTFRLAFALAGKSSSFEQVSIPPSCPLDASSTNAEPVTYLHAGMIQHDPSGIPTFLHRTAEGKVYPFNNGYRKAHYVTVPLSSRRAAGVLGHDTKKMGLRGDQIDHATYQNCTHPVPQTFHAVCGVSLKSGTYPVPVIPVAEIADLAPVLDASYGVHDHLQHAFHTTFVVG